MINENVMYINTIIIELYNNNNSILTDKVIIDIKKIIQSLNINLNIDAYILKNNIDLFVIYSVIFHFQAKNDSNLICGIDFEYENRKIALWQICFFDNKKYIWLIDPKNISDKQLKLINKYLFCSKSYYKILHGSDSIDIPYLYLNLFKKEKETILKFTRKLVDTRFLCEFDKYLYKENNKKCSIYDALLYYSVIDNKEYEYLNNIANKMGIIYKLKWNMNNLSDYQVLYAIYDVFYLKDLMKNIFNKNNYKSLEYIPNITGFVLLEKNNITNLINHITFKYGDLNMYSININNETKSVNYFFDKIKLKSIDIYIEDLLKIDYFRKIETVIYKYILLCVIQNNNYYDIDKKIIFNIQIIYKFLNNVQLYRFINLIKIIIESSNEYFMKISE